MSKIFIISFIFIFFTGGLYSQVLKIDNGVSLSWSNNSSKLNVAYTGAVGLDYLEKEHFMLNSKLGYISKGEDVPMIVPVGNRFKVNINYLNFSTTARFTQPVSTGSFFIGIGPSFDFKLNSKYEMDGYVQENEEPKGEFLSQDFVFGFLVDAGYFYDITDWRFELKAGYYNNITKILPETRIGLISHCLSVSVGVGYIF